MSFLMLCKTGGAVGNCKPCSHSTAVTPGEGSKSQIDLNQLPGCSHERSPALTLCFILLRKSPNLNAMLIIH